MHRGQRLHLWMTATDISSRTTKAWLAQIMARPHGVGSDGILLVQPSGWDFRMRFFNPDGGEAEIVRQWRALASRVRTRSRHGAAR